MHLELRNDYLRAVINTDGAELVSLENPRGNEPLWTGGPEWPRRAPVLFPIIGRTVRDVLLHAGKEHPMKQHGFARDSKFTVLDSTPETAHLRLRDSPETKARFPFPFSLEIFWVLEGPTLALDFLLTNTGESVMPVSIGWHPAFKWDKRPGWKIEFDQPEPDPVRHVRNVLLTPRTSKSPVKGRVLPITEETFAEGAIIFEGIHSRKVRLSSPSKPVLDMEFPDFPNFAVWKEPSAGFVCLEPWHGLPSPETFEGEYALKPGQVHIRPQQTKELKCRVTVH